MLYNQHTHAAHLLGRYSVQNNETSINQYTHKGTFEEAQWNTILIITTSPTTIVISRVLYKMCNVVIYMVSRKKLDLSQNLYTTNANAQFARGI